MNNLTKEDISNWLQSLQDNICQGLETYEPVARFKEDLWTRSGGGGGRSRVISGEVIEKGGVNYSAVHGELPEKIQQALNIDVSSFYATGVSIVLHPKNPHVPIIHMNVRFFETAGGPWWFGGGIDLTPHYVIEEDAHFFHSSLKNVCDKNDKEYYPKFKKWADDYFYVKHRKETRGIGGIFYDKLSGDSEDKKQIHYQFMQDVGNSFLPIYTHLLDSNIQKKFTDAHKRWQKIRRGRYVEFNLVWDRGTKFGLDTDGRTESILMSLPPEVNWVYNHKVKEGSEEAKTQSLLIKDIDWVNHRVS